MRSNEELALEDFNVFKETDVKKKKTTTTTHSNSFFFYIREANVFNSCLRKRGLDLLFQFQFNDYNSKKLKKTPLTFFHL